MTMLATSWASATGRSSRPPVSSGARRRSRRVPTQTSYEPAGPLPALPRTGGVDHRRVGLRQAGYIRNTGVVKNAAVLTDAAPGVDATHGVDQPVAGSADPRTPHRGADPPLERGSATPPGPRPAPPP